MVVRGVQLIDQLSRLDLASVSVKNNKNFIASQVITVNLEVVEIRSFVRGYHAYKEVWDPVVGQMLLLKRQPDTAMQ